MLLSLLCIILASLLTIACTQDYYDKGEGKYSLMRADFVEAHTNGQKQIDYIVTDDGDRLALSTTVSTKWTTTADTLYRCILYYNKVSADDGSIVAEPVSIQQVGCPRAIPLSSFHDEVKTDPVRFESAWISKSGRYLNVSLYVMTGSTDDAEAAQALAFLCDTVMTHPDQTRTCFLRLYHDQGSVPQYYSAQVYRSIPMSDLPADTIRFQINTYDGPTEKVLITPRMLTE